VWQRNDGDAVRFDAAAEAAASQIAAWRERRLRPWRYEQRCQTDEELEKCINTIFVMYGSQDGQRMLMSRSAAVRMCRDARALGTDLTSRVRTTTWHWPRCPQSQLAGDYCGPQPTLRT
jgi:hypothetical protein